MSKELAVLHDEMRVGRRVIEITVHDRREDARVGQGVARDGDARRSLAVRVVGREEPRKASVRLAPGGLLQVVTAPVRVAIGEIRVAHNHLVLLAARHRVPRLGQVQVDPRQQLIRVRTLEELAGRRVQRLRVEGLRAGGGRRGRLSVAQLRHLGQALRVEHARVDRVCQAARVLACGRGRARGELVSLR